MNSIIFETLVGTKFRLIATQVGHYLTGGVNTSMKINVLT